MSCKKKQKVLMILTIFFAAVLCLGVFSVISANLIAEFILLGLSAVTAASFIIFNWREILKSNEKADEPKGTKKNTEGDCTHTKEKFSNLISIIEDIEINQPFKDILKFIYDSFSPYIPYSHIGVALIDETGTLIRAAYGISGKQNPNLAKRIVGYKTNLRETSLTKILQSGKPRVINDLNKYLDGRPKKKYNQILLEEGISSSITFPLIKNNKPIAIIFFSSSKVNVYKEEHVEFLKTIANSIMLSLEKNLLLDEMVVSSTLALATLAEERDNETGQHLERMKNYAVLLAELLPKNGYFAEIIDTDYINSLQMFCPLHDIGKVAISDSILLKPGRLTPDEFEVMKTHTTYGGKVLRLAEENVKKHGRSIFKMGIEITEGHHEWWDGSGYPFHRGGESIPLSARIAAVADVFDALTSKRPYKKPFSFEDSVKMITEESGSHFDPRLIEVLNKNLPAFKALYCRFSEKPQID